MKDRISLVVQVNGQHISAAVGTDIPELYQYQFEPIRTGDCEVISRLAGEATMAEATAKLTLRKDAARILSRELVKMLLSEMGKNDTHNGYKKGE